MAFDGLVTKLLVDELNPILLGGKINKIYEPSKNEIILDIYNKNKFLLNICIDSSNCRMNLTKHTKSNPKVAPNFCMVLRKYLTSSKITSIENYNLDRIVIINLENYNELNDLVNYKLIIELMGKHSNILLVNSNNIIIDCIRHISSSQALRTMLPANPYIFPTSDKVNLLKINNKEFIDIIEKEKDTNNLIDILSKSFTGISKSFIIHILEKLNISSYAYTLEDLNCLYNYINGLINSNNIECELFEFNNKKDFAIVKSNSNTSASLNEFIDEFYSEKENEELFINYRNSVLKLVLSILNKYNKKLVVIRQKLDECKDMEQFKLYGELITSNLYKINNNINLDSIQLENYYDNNNLISIPLDKKISPSLNAKKYFKKYNKLKNTLNIVTSQKDNLQQEISYLESIIYSLESSNAIDEIEEIHQEIEKNILGKTTAINNKSNKIQNKLDLTTFNIDGFTVYIGKNNNQNDIITFKKSDKTDLWFHVQGFHGSHVLLKTNGKEIKDDTPIIQKCAKLASLHSKASNEKKVAVDYTLIKNIKKPKGAKPGFVIFNEYKTIIIENN